VSFVTLSNKNDHYCGELILKARFQNEDLIRPGLSMSWQLYSRINCCLISAREMQSLVNLIISFDAFSDVYTQFKLTCLLIQSRQRRKLEGITRIETQMHPK
jgi:hypothetical protein